MRCFKFKKFFQNNYCFACIIYPAHLRYVITKVTLEKTELMDYGKVSLPLQSQLLQSYKKLCAFKKSKVFSGVANELSHLKMISINRDLNPYEVNTHVKNNVFKFFKYTYQALYLDYRLILQNLRVLPIHQHQQYLQMVAVKRVDLNHGLSALKRLNIKFSMLGTESFALIRLLQKVLKRVPNLYMLIFFEENKFSLLVVEKNYLIYKNYYRFMFSGGLIKTDYVIQAVTLTQSLYASVKFDHYIVIGNRAHILYPEELGKKFYYIDVSSFVKTNCSNQNISDYYAAIGLTI